MDTRKCKKCGQVKPVTEFHKAGTQNGIQQYRTKCAACSVKPQTAQRWALREQGLKQCAKCERVLPLENFYDDKRKVDGKREVCKACHIETTTVYRQTNGHDKFIAAKRNQNHRPDYMSKRAEYMRTQRERATWANQESARHAVGQAVASSTMPSACKMQCADCGAPAKEYHHASYERDRWLDVTPLCIDCHKRRHAR